MPNDATINVRVDIRAVTVTGFGSGITKGLMLIVAVVNLDLPWTDLHVNKATTEYNGELACYNGHASCATGKLL